MSRAPQAAKGRAATPASNPLTDDLLGDGSGDALSGSSQDLLAGDDPLSSDDLLSSDALAGPGLAPAGEAGLMAPEEPVAPPLPLALKLQIASVLIGTVGLVLAGVLIYLTAPRIALQHGVPKVELVSAAPASAGSAGAAAVADTPTWSEAGLAPDAGLAALARALAARGSVFDDPSLGPRSAQAAEEAPVALKEIPRAERWQIVFPEGATEQEYSQMLDFFGIELGVLVGGGQIEYGFNFSQKQPGKRTGAVKDEPRLYMAWVRGNYADADRTLLSKAGIDGAGKIVLQFYTEITENKLAALEEKFADRKPDEILRTRFSARPSAEGYSFYVLDQTPLK